MALYAFDGTGNIDEIDDDKDTNVVRFTELYDGKINYIEGIATEFNTTGNFLSKVTGFGAKKRIEEMVQTLASNYNNNDTNIDVIGFSRGASLAIHFCNTIADHGIQLNNGEIVKPKIRFLGVWDTVGAFGIPINFILPFQRINWGWKITKVPALVQHCYHALALDERRSPFEVTRLSKQGDTLKFQEMWFRGTHVDIGGGKGDPPPDPARHNISLNWILEHAEAAGLSIKQDLLHHPKYSEMDSNSRFFLNRSAFKKPNRLIKANDVFHDSVEPLSLSIGQTHTFISYADQPYNWSRVRLIQGCEYLIEVREGDLWADGKREVDASGWRRDYSNLNPILKLQAILSERLRRVPSADWFYLCGSYGHDWQNPDYFAIGKSHQFIATRTAELYTFANDLKVEYGNNRGSLEVSITRM